MAKKENVDARVRNFACVVYPESAPEDWVSILSEQHVPAFVSPLHDQDVNPTGELKKAHHHVMVMFEGKKSTAQAQELFAKIGGVGVEIVNSLRGYARYLCHLDNPEKAQYSIDDVVSLSGADYDACIGLPTDKYKCIKEMMQFCKQGGVYAYCDLLDYAAENRPDWFRVLTDSSTVVITSYLKSMAWKMQEEHAYHS